MNVSLEGTRYKHKDLDTLLFPVLGSLSPYSVVPQPLAAPAWRLLQRSGHLTSRGVEPIKSLGGPTIRSRGAREAREIPADQNRERVYDNLVGNRSQRV